MIAISKVYSFDSSHQLWNDKFSDEQNLAWFGKCARLHGHTYTLDVMVQGAIDVRTGMILNYFEMDKVIKPFVDNVLDHKHLNDVFPGMLTTAENMVEVIGHEIVRLLEPVLDPSRGGVDMVSLSETPKTQAVWST